MRVNRKAEASATSQLERSGVSKAHGTLSLHDFEFDLLSQKREGKLRLINENIQCHLSALCRSTSISCGVFIEKHALKKNTIRVSASLWVVFVF